MFADVSITQIMYDLEGSDSKREWIQVCGDEDLTGWKFNDGSNHNLVEVKGSLILSDCAILASDATTYISEHVGYSGTVIDTVMSLGNTTDTLSLINDSGVEVFSVTYTKDQGANGDGNFLEFVNGVWKVSGSPTTSIVDEVVSTGGGPVFQEEIKITAYAGNDRVVSVGADSIYEGHVYGELHEPLEGARYMWNFGNGRVTEGDKVLHHYDYPGKYVVYLNVAHLDYTKYSASDRIIVTAKPADISITSAVPEYITLTNFGDRELDLSFWILRSGLSKFTLPENTVVLPQSDVIFSYTVTGLGVPNQYDVELLYPNSVSAFRYFPEILSNVVPVPVVIKPIIIESVEMPIFEEKIVTEQPAAVILAQDREKNGGWFLALIGVIILGIVSAIVIRRKV